MISGSDHHKSNVPHGQFWDHTQDFMVWSQQLTTTCIHEEIKSTLYSKYAYHVVHIFVSWYTLWVWNLFFQTKGTKYIREFKNMALGISEQKWEEHKGKQKVVPLLKYYCNDQI